MRITKKSILTITTVLLLASCGSDFYSKKELRTQTVPIALQNKIWILRKINSAIQGPSFAAEFNNSNGTVSCPFTFKFADKGELIMTFKEHQFTGVYLVSGNKFRYLHNGFNEKIIWKENPECKITPTELGYVFNVHGEFQFKIDGDTLTLNDNLGSSFILTSDI